MRFSIVSTRQKKRTVSRYRPLLNILPFSCGAESVLFLSPKRRRSPYPQTSHPTLSATRSRSRWYTKQGRYMARDYGIGINPKETLPVVIIPYTFPKSIITQDWL